MAKMIPGRIRNEGIDLYEKGLVSILSDDDNLIDAEVSGVKMTYSYDDSFIRCACELFTDKGYCQHLAAVEAFLLQDQKGKALSAQLVAKEEVKKEVSTEFSLGRLFLESLSMNEDDTVKYQLSVSGDLQGLGQEIYWTLYLSRLPHAKPYIVRDIEAFLKSVRNETAYQIGKQYFEPLSLIQFDDESQALIDFLWPWVDEGKRGSESLFKEQGRYLVFPEGFFEEGIYLLQQLDDFKLTIDGTSYTQTPFSSLESDHDLFHFEVEVHRNYLELIVSEREYLSFFKMSYLFYAGIFYHLDLQQQKIANVVTTLPIGDDLNKHIRFHLDDQSQLALQLLNFKRLGQVKAPQSFEIRDFDVLFLLDMSSESQIRLQLTFDYGSVKVSSREGLETLPFTSNFKKEEKILRFLREEGFSLGFDAIKRIYSPADLYDVFSHTVPKFEQLGQVILSDSLKEKFFSEQPQFYIHRQNDLLDISFDVSGIDSLEVDEAISALMSNQPYVVSRTGQLVIFDDETKKVSQVLQQLRYQQVDHGTLRVVQSSAFQLLDVLQDNHQVIFSRDFQKLVHDLTHPEEFSLPELSVTATLRDYQLTGIRWLSMLNHYGFAGVLADDMGLGKTLQTIAFLEGHLNDSTKVLILSPSSLIYNWKDEFSKFTPELDVAVVYGHKPVREALITEEHQIIVTSYASFRQDFEHYRQLSYDYLILDEAQVMKNSQTKIAQCLREFDVKQCFALSGTPIENHLLEIWSIFQIIMPGLLPSKRDFTKLTAKEVARYISPFILRRRKEDVLPELPDLIETVYSNELTDAQKAIYLAQLRQMQDVVRDASDEQINRRKVEILSGITRLRQICDTPRLFMDYSAESGKLASLRHLLSQLKENGRRALVFSQFRGMLDIAEKELNELGLTSYKLTGSTVAKDRQEMTKAFNKGAKDVFLISLKAGGVGLNLTGADTVILVDLWWNPAVEMQAISRAHRLGQKQNVEVYRLITKGTIEEKILALQESKKNLVTAVLDGNESHSTMTVEDIRDILGLT